MQIKKKSSKDPSIQNHSSSPIADFVDASIRTMASLSVSSTADSAVSSIAAPATTVTSVAVSHSPAAYGVPTAPRPSKTSQTSLAPADVNTVKKKLFPPLSINQEASSIPATGKKDCYKMKEDDLWTKLFTL